MMTLRLWRFCSFAAGLVVAVLVGGCTEVPPSNPFDPATPIAQQARSLVSGQLALPEGFSDVSIFTGAQLQLTSQSATIDTQAYADVGADGQFAFEQVPAGAYTMTGSLPGMEPISREILVERGVDLPLRPYVLRIQVNEEGASTQWIEGTVRLEGNDETGHGGVVVETEGRPFQTTTTGDGLFRLEVPPGTYLLRIRSAGFGVVSYPDVVVSPGEVTRLDDVLLARDLSSSVSGQITSSIEGFDWGRRARLTLMNLAGLSDIRVTTPAGDGTFLFDLLQPGSYALKIDAEGHLTKLELVELGPGLTDLGPVAVIPEFEAPDAVEAPIMRGTARMGDRGDALGHGGITVQALVGDDLVSTTQTSDTGAFVFTAARTDYLLKFTAPGYRETTLRVTWSEEEERFEAFGQALETYDEIVLEADLSARLAGTLSTSLAGFPWAETTTVTLVGDGRERSDSPNADGSFQFLGLRAGDYFLAIDAQGHAPELMPIVIQQGDNELGVIGLRTEFEAPEAGVPLLGFAQLDDQQGRPDGSHMGILVQVFTAAGDELVASTQTDESGRYIVATAARLNYRLRFVRAGYQPQNLDVSWSDVGRFEVSGEALSTYRDLVLEGRPGNIAGAVRLREYESPARLQSIDIELRAADAPDVVVRGGSPNAAGRFSLSDVDAGDYILSVNSVGYDPIERPTTVRVDEHVDLGILSLAHHSTTPRAVPFRGRVQLADNPNHAGTQVDLLFAGTAQVLGSTQTDANGNFAIAASPDEGYTVVIRRAEYTVPSADQLGLFRHEGDAFVSVNGGPLDLLLERNPLNGSIQVAVDIRPNWIPQEQQFVRISVRQQGGVYQRTIEGVTERQPAVFDGVPAGDFEVVIERPGFATVHRFARLDEANPARAFPEAADAGSGLVIRLNNLAAAQIDLEGQTIAACDLRDTTSAERFTTMYNGADFSGSRLVGDFGPSAPNECPRCDDDGRCCDAQQVCAQYHFGAFNFSNANFTNAHFAITDELGAPLERPASLAADQLGGAHVNLSRASLFGAQLAGVNLSGADLSNANLFGVNAVAAQLSATNLRGANLTSANLNRARFAGSSGRHDATIFLDRDQDGNDDPEPHPWAGMYVTMDPLPNDPCNDQPGASVAQVQDANFAQADLSEAFLAGVNLSRAVLADARVVGGDLRASCLRGASLNLVDLSDANLDGADLSSARMTNAIMYATQLRGSDLTDSTLTSAVIEQASFMGRVPVDNEDPCLTLLPWSEYEEGGACANPDALNEQCRCRTRLRGANLNGSNLIGARFDGADLMDASLLGLTVGTALERPIDRPADCDPSLTDACHDFCPYYNECGLNGERPPEPLDCGEFSQLCPRWEDIDSDLSNFFSLSDFMCILKVAASKDDCSLNEEEFFGCLENYGRLRPADHLPDLPPKCTFDNMQETWARQAEEPARDCGPEDTPADGPWACCPVARIPPQCAVAKTHFNDTRLTNAQMTAVSLDEVVFTNAIFDSADMQNSSIARSTFSGADLTGIQLQAAELNNLDWAGADLHEAQLQRARLNAVDLTRADLTRVALTRATLSDVSLDYTTATAPEDGGILNELWSVNFREAIWEGRLDANDDPSRVIQASWPSATFRNASIERINFESGNLPAADFSSARLALTSFTGSRDQQELDMVLSGANFGNSSLLGVDFSGADLTEASFVNARFGASEDGQLSSVRHSDLTDATLDGLRVEDTRFEEGIFERTSMGNSSFGPGTLFEDLTLSEVNFDDSSFEGTDFRRVTFRNLNLGQVDFVNIKATELRFEGTTMSRQFEEERFPVCRPDALAVAGCSMAQFIFDRVRDVGFRSVTFDSALGPIGVSNAPFTIGVRNSNLSGTLFLNTQPTSELWSADSTLDKVRFQGGELSLRLEGGIDANGERTMRMRGAQFEEVHLETPNVIGAQGWSFVDFSPTLNERTVFNNVTLHMIPMTEVDLTEAWFIDSTLSSFIVENSILNGVFFENSDLSAVRFRGAHQGAGYTTQLDGSRWNRLHFNDVLFDTVDLSNAFFDQVTVSRDGNGLVFKSSRLTDARLSNLDAFRLHFEEGTDLSRTGLLNVNATVAEFSNATLVETRFEAVDFTHSNFENADMRQVSFRTSSRDNFVSCGVSVGWTSFQGADLSGAILTGVCDLPDNMRGANLDGAFVCRDVLPRLHNYVGQPVEARFCIEAPLCPSSPECQPD